MNVKWKAVTGSALLAVGAWVLIQEPEVNPVNEGKNAKAEMVSAFADESIEQEQKVDRNIKVSSAIISDKKRVQDLYRSYRNDDITLSDANEAEQILNDMLLSLKYNEAFVLSEAKFGSEGSTYYKFKQTYEGLDVYGSEISVQVSKANKLESILGIYSSEISLDTTPSISGTEALTSSLNTLSDGDTVTQKVFQEPELMVYMDYDNNAHLAYESVVKYIDTSGTQQINTLFTDANTAEVIDTISNIYADRDIDVYTVNGKCIGQNATLPGYLARDNDYAVGDASADSVYDSLNTTYFFFKHMFNRHSYDANDARLVATVDAQFSDGGSCNGLNAYFSPYDKQFVFGTGGGQYKNFAMGLDIVAHELTHAFTWKTSNLEYRNESGALNETISDIFGVTIQAWDASGGGVNGNPSTIKIENDTWIMGEDVGLYRYLNDPMKDGQSPDNYDDKYTGSQDNGGVHINSVIGSLSFALLSEGGKHPRNKTNVEVPGIGMDKALRIWYEAQTTTMSTRSNFNNIRAILSNAAASLYSECSPEYKAVELSMDAVKFPGSWECAEDDITSPVITGIAPADGSTDLAVSAIARVRFNEPMARSTINTSTITLTNANSVSVAGTVSMSGEIANFTPASNLDYDSTYTFTITTGVTDVAGNALVTDASFSFTTEIDPDGGDTTSPEIINVSPEQSMVDVDINASIEMSFSEAIDSNSLISAFSLSTQSGNNVYGSVSVSGSKATFTPASPLMANTTYIVMISTDLKDVVGNALTSEKEWSFTTKADPETSSDISLTDARITSSSQYSYSYRVENVSDSNPSTFWLSKTNNRGRYQTEWLQIDLANNSSVNNVTIDWYDGYSPKELELWATVDGSWKRIQGLYVSGGETTISVNEDVGSIHLAMRGGSYGKWFVIRDISVE